MMKLLMKISIVNFHYRKQRPSTSIFRICNALKTIVGTDWTHNSILIILGIVDYGLITSIVAYHVVVLCLCTPRGVCVRVYVYVCMYA